MGESQEDWSHKNMGSGEEQSHMQTIVGEGCDYQLVIGIGTVTFAVVNSLTGLIVPEVACQTRQQKWKWRNVATSLVHSLVTGVWAPLSFYQVVMNIILFCRVLSVDFSPGLVTACKTDSHTQPGGRSGTIKHLTLYTRSLFQEDGTSTNKTTKD